MGTFRQTLPHNVLNPKSLSIYPQATRPLKLYIKKREWHTENTPNTTLNINDSPDFGLPGVTVAHSKKVTVLSKCRPDIPSHLAGNWATTARQWENTRLWALKPDNHHHHQVVSTPDRHETPIQLCTTNDQAPTKRIFEYNKEKSEHHVKDLIM